MSCVVDAREEDLTATEFDALVRLNQDLRQAALDLPASHARYLVDIYYQIQDARIRIQGQMRAASMSVEPHGLLDWTFRNMRTLENDLKSGLGTFAQGYRVGQWMQSICGIGPVISAGLLAALDIRKAPTVGQFWRFAGLDPGVEWLGQKKAAALVAEVVGDEPINESHLLAVAERVHRHPENLRRLIKGKLTKASLTKVVARRPWSNSLKRLCVGNLADCFVRVQNRKNDFYGAYYAAHREKEAAINESGGFADQAAAALKAKKYGKTTEAHKHYIEGRLPPAHLHNRSERYAVKLFLSHLHHVMYEDFYNKPAPRPYILQEGTGHTHWIKPPNWPGEFGGHELRRLYQE